jgi:hypothetical protein
VEARGITIVRQWPKAKEGLVRVRLMTAAARTGSALAGRLNGGERPEAASGKGNGRAAARF